MDQARSAGRMIASVRQSTTVVAPVRPENRDREEPEIGNEDRHRAKHEHRVEQDVLGTAPHARAPARRSQSSAMAAGFRTVASIIASRSAVSAAAPACRRSARAPCERDTDDDQAERQRCAIGVLAVLECAPIDIERKDGRVVERAAIGDEPDVFEAHQQCERLVDRHEAELPADRRKGDVPDDRKFACAVHPCRVEKVVRDRPDRTGEDDHSERCADEAVRQDDDEHRRVALEVERRKPQPGEHLVQEAVIGRRDDPAPQQRIHHGRAHPGQDPDGPEEGPGAIRQGGGQKGEQQPIADIEDGQRAKHVGQGDDHDAGQAAIAAEHAREILGGEAGHPQVPAHVRERNADIYDHGHDKEHQQQDDRGSQEQYAVEPGSGS